MSQELLKTFRNAMLDLTRRYEGAIHKTIGFSYVFGEGLYAAVPMVKSGFLSSVAKFNPDWSLFSNAYMDRPIPVLASAICIAGSYYMSKGKISKGYGICGVGNSVMAADMLWSGEPASALVSLLSIVGCAKLAAHEHLYKRFGKHSNRYLRHSLGRPMLTGGALLAYSYVPLIGVSFAEGSYAATVSAAGWSTGALLTMLLQSKNKTEHKVEAEVWKLEHVDGVPPRISRRRKTINGWAKGKSQIHQEHRYRSACSLRK